MYLALGSPLAAYLGVADPRGFSFLRVHIMTTTAILVDGAFFVKRYKKVFKDKLPLDPSVVASDLFAICQKHLESRHEHVQRSSLYRIFYYDCFPSDKRVHHPISGQAIHFLKSDQYQFQHALFNELSKKRKVALRLGRLAQHSAGWRIRQGPTKELLKKTITVDDLAENDVSYEIKQKGVDMRIGLDIASLAYKKLVDQIVLIAGDADFVPAAKLARREGIDVVLDPMWTSVGEDLFLHIDGLRSTCPNPNQAGE